MGHSIELTSLTWLIPVTASKLKGTWRPSLGKPEMAPPSVQQDAQFHIIPGFTPDAFHRYIPPPLVYRGSVASSRTLKSMFIPAVLGASTLSVTDPPEPSFGSSNVSTIDMSPLESTTKYTTIVLLCPYPVLDDDPFGVLYA
jgi:hypothetical protein